MSDANQTKRTVAVTGAGGNVAGAVAGAFRERGWNVALIDSGRNVDRLRNEWPDAEVAAADLTRREETAAAVKKIRDAFGSVDALVHLAGGFATGGATDIDSGDLERMLDRNLVTLFTTVQAVVPAMVDRGSGSIVGVSARQALEGGRNVTAYAAAKGALISYLRALRHELEPAGVAVSVLVPWGTIDTPENRDAMPHADPETWIGREDVAEALAYLATRPRRGRIAELTIRAAPRG